MGNGRGAHGRTTRRERHVVPRVVAGSVFVGAVVLLAAVAAWPIYRDASFLLLIAVTVPVAAAIAVLARRRGWGGWPVTGALVAAFAVLAVPLAVPSRLTDPVAMLRGVGEAAAGVLLSWKDLVTVDLPVGSYRNLLVPVLIVFLVGTCVALVLAWRADRVAYAAVPVAFGMISFGLFFGRTGVSAPLRLGPLTLPAPVETAIGVGALLLGLLWLAWRTREERISALRAAAPDGRRASRRRSGADRRRLALGAGMVALAVVAAAAVVPFAARGAERQVIRSAVGPESALASAVSPLAAYRGLFADERAQTVLFTVTADGALPERVRLATLDGYDGEVYRSGGTGADQSRFVRVPAVRDAGAGLPVEVEISIGELDGIWMPTVGRLASIEFAGPRAASLADRFYYRAAAAAGVQTADGGLQPGDAYRISAVEPPTPDLASIDAPGDVAERTLNPPSLRRWVRAHASGSDGVALAGLVNLLRERGYLSHGLSADDEVWMQTLPGYSFQPSASGHSLARVEALFSRLLQREADGQAAASDNYVAAVGDDEQFATAVALVARELGFPARVVVGARLHSADPGLPVCADGVCRAQDISAWTEVQSAAGAWVPVDVTPQFARSPSTEVSEQRNPENVTEVRPEAVEAVVPPDPVQEDSGAQDRAQDAAAADLAWLWSALRIGGIVLLVSALVVGPFAVIAAAKAARRRSRRTQGDARARIAGGWDEYVDAAVDSGHEAAPGLTRAELADLFGTPAAHLLAADADHAVFSGAAMTTADAERFWSAVEQERRALLSERGVRHRIRATVSLTSFVRHLAPAGAGPRLAERGSVGFRRPRTSS